MQDHREMWGTNQNSDTANMVRALGGAQWGLLPALICWPVLVHGGWLSWPQTAMVVLAGIMAAGDIAERRIPNTLNLITLVVGLACSLALGGPMGLAMAGLSVAMVFAFMTLLFFMGAIGGGDAKALAALAAFLAPVQALQLFVLTALSGGVLAVSLVVCTRFGGLRSQGPANILAVGRGREMPYGVAIWSGVLLMVAGGLA